MTTTNEDALKTLISSINKQCGAGTVALGNYKLKDVEGLTTSSLGLDLALGVGGFPRGRISEIYGPESSGKTTIVLSTIANVQKNGGTAALIDVEHAVDPVYATKLGVDMDKLIFSQPDTGEQVFEVAEMLADSGKVDFIGIDSVAAIIPKAELEGNIDESHIGVQARLMSKSLRKIKGKLNKTNTALLFTNQIRMKIGVMFGNPETTSGGNALKFYASTRVDIRREKPITVDNNIIGNHVKVKVVKNKVAPPFKTAEFDILYGIGIDDTSFILDKAVEMGLITKSSTFYTIDGQKFNGGKQAGEYINSHIELKDKLRAAIIQKANTGLVLIEQETQETTDEIVEEPK